MRRKNPRSVGRPLWVHCQLDPDRPARSQKHAAPRQGLADLHRNTAPIAQCKLHFLAIRATDRPVHLVDT